MDAVLGHRLILPPLLTLYFGLVVRISLSVTVSRGMGMQVYWPGPYVKYPLELAMFRVKLFMYGCHTA
ncbi:hypothetical protein A9W96_18445 [Mycobacterium sp. 1245852.3]|nr:hypothetical protein A9W96_18445 [Mycobacterium sp. 1245852.3]